MKKKWSLSTLQALSLLVAVFNIFSSVGIDYFISQQVESLMILPQKTEDLFAINRTRHAIVVPYRNRSLHLSVFRKHMSDYFQSRFGGSGSNFDVWIIEQDDDEPFNRGWLTNVGIVEAIKHSPDVQCIILHDVDLVPDIEGCNNTVPYDKCEYPTRLGNELEHFNWQVMYPTLFGGVSGISKKHWMTINGMSNLFSGWGGEDDDLYERVRINQLLMGERMWDKEIQKGFLLTPPHSHGMFRVIDESQSSHPVKRERTPQASAFVTKRLGMMRKSSNVWKDDGLSTLAYLLRDMGGGVANQVTGLLDNNNSLGVGHRGNSSIEEPLAVVSVMHNPVHLDSPKDLPGFASYHHIYARWDPSKDNVTRKTYNNQGSWQASRPAPKKANIITEQKRQPPKIEFLHITKTGGSAIEKAGAAGGFRWGACHYNHASYKEMGCPGKPDLQGKTRLKDFIHESPWHVPLQNFLINHFRDDHVFTVVRNPYDRVLSSYYDRWHGFGGSHSDQAVSGMQSDAAVMNAFVRKLLQKPKDHTFTLPQHLYVWDSSKNQSMVQTVLRYENLTASFNELMRMKNITNVILEEKPFNSPHLEKGAKKLTVDDFDNITLALIEKKYEKDFEMFGYEKRVRQ